MEIVTTIKAILYVIGGYIAYFLGGYDLLLRTVLSLTVIDFITGTVQAIYNGKFSAKKSAKGTCKKVFIYFCIALAVIIQRYVGDSIPIRETVILFYIASEGMSTLENIGKVIEYPKAIKELFESLKDEEENE